MSRKQTTLITGATGQDGALLAKRLLESGQEVICGFRRGGAYKIWRLEELGAIDHVKMVELEITEFQNVLEVIKQTQPDFVYHFAAQSFVLDSFKYPGLTASVNSIGTLNVLEAIRMASPETRLFNASTSELFGDKSGHANEETPFDPRNPYSISKLYAHLMVRGHREAYGLRCSSGILFNHESRFRGREFVSRKIAFNMARLRLEGGKPVSLGRLDSVRDWGAAEDYVRAMMAIQSREEAGDYVIASGTGVTVRKLLVTAAACAGFDLVFEGEGLGEVGIDRKSGRTLVVISEDRYRPKDRESLTGDTTKLARETGWVPAIPLESLIEDMVAADIDRRKKGDIHV